MVNVDTQDKNRSEMVKLQEFLYKHTSEWAEELQKMIEYEYLRESLGAGILFECLYLYLHLVNRVASTKLPDAKAKKLQEALRFFITLGIADLMFEEHEESEKSKQREVLLKNIERTNKSYAGCKELLKKDDLAAGTSLAAKLTKNLGLAMKMTTPDELKLIHDKVIQLTTELFLKEMRQFELRIVRAGNELAIEV